jgi:hypothetical protein
MHKKVDNDDAIFTQHDYSLAFAAPLHDYPYCFGGLLHLNISEALEGIDICQLWHQHHGSWCMKSIARIVHISPQRIGH